MKKRAKKSVEDRVAHLEKLVENHKERMERAGYAVKRLEKVYENHRSRMRAAEQRLQDLKKKAIERDELAKSAVGA